MELRIVDEHLHCSALLQCPAHNDRRCVTCVTKLVSLLRAVDVENALNLDVTSRPCCLKNHIINKRQTGIRQDMAKRRALGTERPRNGAVAGMPAVVSQSRLGTWDSTQAVRQQCM